MRSNLLVLLPALLMAACSGGSPGGEPAPTAPAAPDGPALTSVTPDVGDLPGGTPVRIEGSGFLDEEPIWVRFGDRIVEILASDDGVLEVDAPRGESPGPVDVGVVTTRGRAVLPAAYAYRKPSAFLSFAPVVGFYDAALGGTRITVAVFNKPPLEAPRVSFAAIESPSVEMLNEHTLVARVPPGLLGGEAIGLRVEDGWETTTFGFRAQGALAPGDLIVNEWLAHAGTLDTNGDGTASAGGDEFIEIVNRLDVAVDLSHSSLHDASALRHRFPNPTTVPARGAIVVFGFGNPRGFAALHASGHAQVASTGDLGLNNGGDRIELVDPAGVVLFEVVYGGADVEPGVSRQNPTDGGVLPAETRGSDYLRHDEFAGWPVSPGLRVDGTPFE